MTEKNRTMYRVKKPDGTYTAALELLEIHTMLGDVEVENWMRKAYNIEKWDSTTGTWREW